MPKVKMRIAVLVRLNSDGSPNPAFVTGDIDADLSFPASYWQSVSYPLTYFPYPNSAVSTIHVQPDGEILVAGNFVSIGKQFSYGYAQLNADGTPLGWTRLQPPVAVDQGQWLLRITAPIGKPMVLEISSNLVDWVPLMSTTPKTSVFEWIDPSQPPADHRFYRVHSQNE